MKFRARAKAIVIKCHSSDLFYVLFCIFLIYTLGYFGAQLFQHAVEGCLHAAEISREEIPACMLATAKQFELLPIHFSCGGFILFSAIKLFFAPKS